MRKLLSILGALGLTASASAAVVSCGYAGGFFFLGKNLLSDVVDIDLGTYNQDPSVELLKNNAMKINPKVVENEVEMEKEIPKADPSPQRNEPFRVLLYVKNDSKYYSKNYVWMEYKIDFRKRLDEIIVRDYLGSFQEVLDADLIKAELKKVYTDLDINQIDVIDITNSTAKIVPKPDSEDYVLDSSKTISFDYGELKSLRAILDNEPPLKEFHKDADNAATVMDEMRRFYTDLDWDEIEPLDASQFDQQYIIFKVKKGSLVYLQDTVKVPFKFYQRVLVDSVIDDHSLKNLTFMRTPKITEENLNKLLDEIVKLNPKLHRSGIVFDHVTKADDFNGISENSITFRASSESIWYIFNSTFTITYKRDFHGWNKFVPAGDLSNNFINIMELDKEEFPIEKAKIDQDLQKLKSDDPLKWADFQNLLRYGKLPNDSNEEYYSLLRAEVQKFGADNFNNYIKTYLRSITAKLKAIEPGSPNAEAKAQLENFYYETLWAGRTGIDGKTGIPGRVMGFVNAGTLDQKSALLANNLNQYAENWLTNWGSPVGPIED